MGQFNAKDMWPKPLAVRVVYSDASSMGYGGYSTEHSGHVALVQWLEWEVQQSSTWCELRK